MSTQQKQKTIHIIPGTHWDREWRFTVDQSLPRLVELVDDLLDILEKNEDYICFHLDGGTVIIEDYLSVRPENAERLRRLIEQGRVATVMWYTLPEMSAVSPEALIRNLLIGKRLADKFGGAMKAGYTATSYGQISQLPQIYAGFDIKCALTYRGTNKHQIPPICRWESPDGTQIYLIRCFDEVTRTNWFFFMHYELVLDKMPRDLHTRWDTDDWPVHMADDKMYQTAFQIKKEKFGFKTDTKTIQTALQHFLQQAEPQAIGDNILALDMEDNACPYYNLPKLINTINQAQGDYFLKISSLDEYVKAAEEVVKGKNLSLYKGELRFTAIEFGFNGLLGMTQSSRMDLKLLNDEAEVELINVAEPLCSFSSLLGGSYEQSLFNRAWLELLKNHAHDSICGAAIDEAHRDNPTRFRTVRTLARECSRKAAEELWTMIDSQTGFKKDDITITFFNTLSSPRKGVYPLVIDLPKVALDKEATADPYSEADAIRYALDPGLLVSYNHFDIVDEKGKKIDFELLEKEATEIELERKLDANATTYNVVRHRILMDADIPAFGYRTYALRPRQRRYVPHPQPGPDRALLAQLNGVLENQFIKVIINPNGTFNLTDKETNQHIEGMHYFCDRGSTGNAHLYGEPLRNYTTTSLGNSAVLTLVENSTLRATWKIDLTMNIPASADPDNRNRSTEMVPLPITTWLTLHRNSRRLEIKTLVNNISRDHKLQVMFPTDVKTDYVYVEGPFDVLKRQIQWNVTGENMEGHYPYQPMGNFLDLTDGKSGVTFFSKGLREYEVVDDPRRTLAITLLRTHRAYMLANRGLLTPEEYAAQSGQHCLGPLNFEYAICLHKGDWLEATILQEAQDFKVPMRIIQGVPKDGKLPAAESFMAIKPANQVQFSALYKNEDGKGYIMRVWNSNKKPVQASIEISMKIKSITKVSMDQQHQLKRLVKKANAWVLPLRKAEIATLLIQP